jgi:hypothetical protein
VTEPRTTYASRRYRRTTGSPTPDQVPLASGGDTPVFDKGRTETAALGPAPFHPFSRTASDRRPGTPLPPEMTGDPHPDRLARAEAIREALMRRDNRYRIEGSEDRVDSEPRPRGPKSSTPDIPKPKSYYIDIPAGSAALEARRGDEVLYFMTVTEAARCMTGERKDGWDKAIRNAMGGVTKGAFGWTWTRLKSRQGRRWSR